jgi:hypothetical protein
MLRPHSLDGEWSGRCRGGRGILTRKSHLGCCVPLIIGLTPALAVAFCQNMHASSCMPLPKAVSKCEAVCEVGLLLPCLVVNCRICCETLGLAIACHRDLLSVGVSVALNIIRVTCGGLVQLVRCSWCAVRATRLYRSSPVALSSERIEKRRHVEAPQLRQVRRPVPMVLGAGVSSSTAASRAGPVPTAAAVPAPQPTQNESKGAVRIG